MKITGYANAPNIKAGLKPIVSNITIYNMTSSLVTVWLLCLISFGYCLSKDDDAESQDDTYHHERDGRSDGSIAISSCPSNSKGNLS